MGANTTASQTHAFLYSNGTMTDLGTLGGLSSDPYDINDNGQVVGFAELTDGQQHAFLYSNGIMTDLGALGGTFSCAYSINNNGQVVGKYLQHSQERLPCIHLQWWNDDRP